MSFSNAIVQTVLGKLETQEGVDAGPTTAANAFEVFDFVCDADSDTITKSPNKSSFTNDETSHTNKRYNVSFKMKLTGAGSAAVTAGTPPPYHPVMLSCNHIGISTPGTDYRYLTTTFGTSTMTFHYFDDKILHKATGFRGTIVDEMIIDDERYLSIQGIALYSSPVDQAPSGVPDFSSFRKGLVDSEEITTVMIHGTEVHGKRMTFTQNATNDFYHTSKVRNIRNSDRKPSASITIAIESLADFNPYALWESEARGVVSWQTGTVTGDIVILSMLNAQIGTPSKGADKGVRENTFDIIPHSTPTGSDDEYEYIIR